MRPIEIVLILTIVIIVFTATYLVVVALRDDKICRDAGYEAAIMYTDGVYCRGVRDGNTVVVPLREVERTGK